MDLFVGILKNRGNFIMSEVVEKILAKKFELEDAGKHPRVVLLGTKDFEAIENDWIQSIDYLPWADTLKYELQRKKDVGNIFLGDGTILGLWVIKVDTIEGFMVF